MKKIFDVYVVQEGEREGEQVKIGKAFLAEGVSLKIILDLFPCSGYLQVKLDSQNENAQ